jgi:ferrous iron transport protein B
MSDLTALDGQALQSLRRVALVGNPNCGKTALFNLLTGARQKVANYAGVTVERKVGQARLPNGQPMLVVDLPGSYSLTPSTPDEAVMLEVIEGRRAGESTPDVIVAVVDATNLRMNLRLVLELKQRQIPLIVALNMADVARANGLLIDVAALAHALGCPVIETVAVKKEGHAALLQQLQVHFAERSLENQNQNQNQKQGTAHAGDLMFGSSAELQLEVRRILRQVAPKLPKQDRFQYRLDAVVMHPVWGLVVLASVLFLIFQAVFSWANLPMDAIKSAMDSAAAWTTEAMEAGPLRSLLVDGVIAGVGSVLVFLPQILILFFFILLLEDSGYLPRAAFACAIPGIMATRTIANWKDRLATIMVAPLMTCSARLPVYALLIGAFVPARSIAGMDLRGLTLFGLYVAGVVGAMAVAWVFKRVWMKSAYQPLMLELPPYRMPNLRNLALGLWERARIFLHRVGGIIFSLMVVLWFLSSYPSPPAGWDISQGPAIQFSIAGMLGKALQVVFAPIGFNWQISIALVPGLAAREVAVGALGTVYSLSAAGEGVAEALSPVIVQGWSLATAYSLLAWFVFAPQCLSTLAVVRRETNSWRYPLLMAAYLFALAYGAAWLTYRATLWLGG